MVDAVVDDQLCRPVTADEVEHLHEHGWVQLKRFVDPAVIGQMLAVAREHMGDDGDSNPMSRYVEAAVAEGGAGIQYFNAHTPNGLRPPVIRPLIDQVGRSAKQLLRRRAPAGPDLGIRSYQDLLVPTLPSSRESRPGRNGPTTFHQDFMTFPVDPSARITFLSPLQATPPNTLKMLF